MESSQVKHIEKIKSSKDNAIVSILKKGPKSTSEIQKELRLKFDFNIPRENLKKEYLLGRLSNKITFENRKYKLKKDFNSENSNTVYGKLILKTKSINSKISIKDLIKEYYLVQKKLRPLVSETHIFHRKKNREKIEYLRNELNLILEQTIGEIVKKNTTLDLVKQYCENPLYQHILSDPRIVEFLEKEKQLNNTEQEIYQNNLENFRIICQIAWEDGKLEDKEEEEIKKAIDEYKILKKDVDQIISEVKIEFSKEILDYESKKLSKKNINEVDKWEIIKDEKIKSEILIDYVQKKLKIKTNSNDISGLFNVFINNLFDEREKHRSPELDLFFENFEEFYNE